MNVVIIDYKAGNTQSVINALHRLDIKAKVTCDKQEILFADKVIFPGVGHARAAMEELNKRDLINTIREIKVPFLGICVGMQLLFDYSEEGNTACLSVIEGRIKKFDSTDYKIPKMGWNTIISSSHQLFKGIDVPSFFYFVHSYYLPITDYTIATALYGESYSAAVQFNNFYGVQFHPEKSGVNGEQLLKNFLSF
jgi:glutamine amidotransferase